MASAPEDDASVFVLEWRLEISGDCMGMVGLQEELSNQEFITITITIYFSEDH